MAIPALGGCKASTDQPAMLSEPPLATATERDAQPVNLSTHGQTNPSNTELASARVAPVNSGVTRTQIIEWSRRRERDETIIDRINQSGTVFHISTAEENRLRDAGVSEDVIRAMRATAWN